MRFIKTFFSWMLVLIMVLNFVIGMFFFLSAGLAFPAGLESRKIGIILLTSIMAFAAALFSFFAAKDLNNPIAMFLSKFARRRR